MTSEYLLLDTNLLILLVLGRYNRKLIGKHKRSREFVPEDYEILSHALRSYRRILVTPNLATEASNLLSQTSSPSRERLREGLAALIRDICEVYVTSNDASRHEYFSFLGLADATIISCVVKDHTVLTMDFRLCGYLTKAGRRVINFNHLRNCWWSET